MAGRRRLILAKITQSPVRGKALKDALGAMNQPVKDYATLAEGAVPKQAKKK